MLKTAVLPFLDPANMLEAAGPWSLLVVGLIVFAETGLLVGFILPGDSLLIISGLLANPETQPSGESFFGVNVLVVGTVIAVGAALAGEVGYWIGHKFGPAIFERKESGFFSIENVKKTNAFFERFGAISVILARFVPVVRTITPVAAGVAHMSRGKYSLYNILGAVIWGIGLTFFGYLVGFIPPVADFVQEYIDLILLAAVMTAVLPTLWHYFQSSRAAKRAEARGEDVVTDHDEAAALVLDIDAIEERRHHHD